MKFGTRDDIKRKDIKFSDKIIEPRVTKILLI